MILAPSLRAASSTPPFPSTPLPPRSTPRRDDCSQHCVHDILRVRGRHFTHSLMVASAVVECWDLHVHDLDSACLPLLLREHHSVEWEYRQLGTSVVRYWYIGTSSLDPHLISSAQLSVSKSALALDYLPALFVLSAVSVVSLALCKLLRLRCVSDFVQGLLSSKLL